MTPLSNPLLLQLDAASKDVEPAFRAFLKELCAAPQQLARFLNMLSMLEHIGSRKIMLSQMHGRLDQETLKHLAEETRHAFFFKRNAEKFAKRELSYAPADTMCPLAAGMYFGRLDAAVSSVINPLWPDTAGYLLVSLLIEIRAGWLYHMFHDILQENSVALSLRSIIAEEEMHLADMTRDATAAIKNDMTVINHLMQIEDDLFRKLWTTLRAEMPVQDLAAA